MGTHTSVQARSGGSDSRSGGSGGRAPLRGPAVAQPAAARMHLISLAPLQHTKRYCKEEWAPGQKFGRGAIEVESMELVRTVVSTLGQGIDATQARHAACAVRAWGRVSLERMGQKSTAKIKTHKRVEANAAVPLAWRLARGCGARTACCGCPSGCSALRLAMTESPADFLWPPPAWPWHPPTAGWRAGQGGTC